MQKRPLSTPAKFERITLRDSMSEKNFTMSAPNILQSIMSSTSTGLNQTGPSNKMVEFQACMSLIPDLAHERSTSGTAGNPPSSLSSRMSCMYQRPLTTTASNDAALKSPPSKMSNAALCSRSAAPSVLISPPSSPPSCSRQATATTASNAVQTSPFSLSTAATSIPMSSSNDMQSSTWPASSGSQYVTLPASALTVSLARAALRDLLTSDALPELPPATKSTVATVTQSEIDFIEQCILPPDQQRAGERVENSVTDRSTINGRRRSPLKTVVDLNQTQQIKNTNSKPVDSRVLPWTFFSPYLPKVKTITREMMEVSEYLDTLILLKTEQDRLMEVLGKANDYPFMTAVHQMYNIANKYPQRFPTISRRHRRPQPATPRMPSPQTVNPRANSSCSIAHRHPFSGVQRARILCQAQDQRSRLVQIVKPMSTEKTKEVTSVQSTQSLQIGHGQTSCSQQRHENNPIYCIASSGLTVTTSPIEYYTPGFTVDNRNTAARSLGLSSSNSRKLTPQLGLRVSNSVNIYSRPQVGPCLSEHQQHLTCAISDVTGPEAQRLPAVDFILSASASRSKR
ncbi:hypothetical protein Btru_010749 [Bulinus truncatus]|nr:hypothetical protein Btru_010749 [Bulinus truncatus]